MKELDNKLLYYTPLQEELTRSIIKPMGLHYREYLILRIVYTYEGMSIEEIISLSNRDHEEVSHFLNQLIEKRIIYLENNNIYMNDEAKDMYVKIKKLIQKKEAEVIESMGFENYNTLITMMGKLIIALSEETEKEQQ